MAASGSVGAVLWDLDGTLVDSADLHYRAWRETLGARGRDHPPEEFAHYFGKRNDHVLRGIFGDSLHPAEALRIAEEKEARFRRLVREVGLRPVPGGREWLERGRRAGLRQALASSAPRVNIMVSIEGLGLSPYLDAIVAAEEVAEGKPDPAIFLEAARRLGVPAHSCVVIEDSPAGLEAARRARMRSVGIVSSHYPSLAADLVVPSLVDLPEDALSRLLAG